VPIASLGTQVTLTYTTTIPGSVIPPVTLSPSTIPGGVTQETVLLPTTVSTEVAGQAALSTGVITTVSSLTESPTIIPGTTVPASTASAITTVVTTTEVHAIMASSSPSASTTKNAAERGRGVEGAVCVVSFFALLLLEY
jgi:hypothetical protein